MLETDFLIIGAGSAGLACALELAALGRVTVLSKDALTLSASDWAQGGIAAVLPESDDSVDQHVADTLRAGAGLCEPVATTQILAQAPAAIARLLHWGVQFDRQDEHWQLTREGGHQARRVLHRADRTGHSIIQGLLHSAQAEPRIQLLPHTLVGALQEDDGRITGAWLQASGQDSWTFLAARAVILASGGLGQVYRHTSNPSVATGDGIDLAWRAGVTLRDLEFVQFHPTTLYSPGEPAFLLSEALRGEGALLRLPNGERFMPRHDERGELAPRDVVSRAITREMQTQRLDHVLLDISHAPGHLIEQHFPNIARHCRERGYDLGRGPIPVVPAAHYSCGGVLVDAQGRTELPGLYAIGEVASTGLHGANRLASNSLLECVVAAHAVYADLAGASALPDRSAKRPPQPATAPSATQAQRPERIRELQDLLWQEVGILRQQQGMERALTQLREWEAEGLDTALPVGRTDLEWRSLLRCALLITEGALRRHESRGCHFDQDFPELAEPPRHLLQRRDWTAPRAADVGRGPAIDANADLRAETTPAP